jgi:hypothetical protein
MLLAPSGQPFRDRSFMSWQSAETLAGKPPLRLQPGNGTLSPHRPQCQLHGGIRLSGATSASSLDSKF